MNWPAGESVPSLPRTKPETRDLGEDPHDRRRGKVEHSTPPSWSPPRAHQGREPQMRAVSYAIKGVGRFLVSEERIAIVKALLEKVYGMPAGRERCIKKVKIL